VVLINYTSINIQFDERVSGGHRNNNRNSESNSVRHATSKELYILPYYDQNYSYNIFSHTAVVQVLEFLSVVERLRVLLTSRQLKSTSIYQSNQMLTIYIFNQDQNVSKSIQIF
jgi:hypothetical protein